MYYIDSCDIISNPTHSANTSISLEFICELAFPVTEDKWERFDKALLDNNLMFFSHSIIM